MEIRGANRMGRTIAISGKGGTGKTTVAGMLVLYLKENKRGPVLAVDADPNSNLHELLGLQLGGTVGELREHLREHLDALPASMTKQEYLEYEIQNSLIESEGFDFIAMGRPEGPSCYCYPNQVLREVIDRLSERYSYVVMDCEAGLEHISRRTTRDVDFLLITSDPTIRGIRTAKRIIDLARSLRNEIKKAYLILNRISDIGQVEALRSEVDKLGLNLVGVVPEDPKITEMDLKGLPINALAENSEAKESLEGIFQKLLA